MTILAKLICAEWPLLQRIARTRPLLSRAHRDDGREVESSVRQRTAGAV